ncbi:NlpC/P60 family protein [Streptomyces sp. NPDC015501]|uniref:C40 family peptidase n=1 Tax=unclassified Streptomyces TaxID=2593676 RepID=UPI0011AA2137|nr:glycoside hydrolase [Streptomyces griseus subsp. griseus]
MSGRLLRAVCTAALAAALTVSPATAAPTEPAPVPSGGSAPPAEAGATGTEPETDGSDAVAPGADEPGAEESDAAEVDAETALAAPEAPESVVALLRELQTRYREAEEATEAYNATAEKLKQRTARLKKVNADLAKARAALESSRRDAGRLAREQYQGHTEFSAYLRLLLARDPQQALDRSHVVGRLAANRAATVERLTGAARRADRLAAASRKALDQQKKLAARQKKERDAVNGRLREVEGLLATLSEDQLTRLAALEQKGVDRAQRELVASGALSSTRRTPTRQGGDAVAYAVRQIGKPYVWGAEGPDSFDCSGLTSAAWSAAGRTIPRTSQEQWKRLPRVPLSALRPGDLVVYFPKATHVALYIGDGLVVQAPRPGAEVKVSPLASNPVLGAVRPDPGGAPLSAYTRPELPEGARDGADTGYSADTAPDAP